VMEVLLSAVEGREPVRLAQVALTLALQESKPMKGARRKPVKNDESFDSHRLEVRGVDVGFAVGAPAPAKIVYHEADVLMVAAGDFREMHHARRSRH
jgi:hypothetical protein